MDGWMDRWMDRWMDGKWKVKSEKWKVRLTNIAGGAARRRHDARILHFRKTKVADHYFAILIRAVVQQILWLKHKAFVRSY